jgi:5-(carboxyamino)imidazole ribonucleotide synthase
MVNIIGEDTITEDVLAIPSVKLHWYNKSKRPGRKMGHINISGDTELLLAQRLQMLAELLPSESFTELTNFTKQYLAQKN